MFTNAPSPAQLAAAAPRLPVVLYDGACAFCTAQAARVRRIAGGRIAVRPLQQALRDVPWIDPHAAREALHLVDRDGRSHTGAAAIVRLLRLTRPGLGLLVLPYHLPGVRWLAARAYAFVANRRSAIAGRTDAVGDACATGACGVAWAERSPANGLADASVRGRGGAPDPRRVRDRPHPRPRRDARL